MNNLTMPRKPSTNKYYFTLETEQAIIAYNESTDTAERSRIYKNHIKQPFEKLAENIIHTFKFYYFDMPIDDVKNEVIAFMNEKLHKFTKGKGKAFSYFSIIAKNYLIIQNNTNYKRMSRSDELQSIDDQRNVLTEISYNDYQDHLSDFFELYINWYDKNLSNIFPSHKDMAVADAVLELFRMRVSIENFNKKALYILIRERTGFKTQNITRVINIMKADFNRMFEEYQKTNNIF
jgi:hypothetical protein